MNVLEEKVSKIFLHYSLPSVFGLLALSSAGIVDGLFIGNIVGATGLASVNLAMPLIALLVGFALMFAAGSSVIAGKYIGEKKQEKADAIFSSSFIASSLFSFLLCLLIYASMPLLNNLFSLEGELKLLTNTYILNLLVFIPFLMVGIHLDYFIKIAERPSLSFLALLLSALANIVLDYLFIVKFELGIQGAALATGIGYVVIVLVLLPSFFLKNTALRFKKAPFALKELALALKNGLSEFVNESSVGITVFVFNIILMQTLGEEGVAAYGVVGYILWINIMVGFGISYALQPIISKHYGALLPARISAFLKLANTSAFVIALFMSLALFLKPAFVVGLFLQEEASNTLAIALEFISYLTPALLCSGFALIITGYLTAMHKPFESALIALTRSLLLPVLLLFVLTQVLGSIGIYVAIPLAEFLTMLLAFYIYKKNSPLQLTR